MDFLKPDLNKNLPLNESPKEIEERMKRRFADRLVPRLKLIRKHVVERNWEALRAECDQLAQGGENFGFPTLKDLAIAARDTIPEGKVTKASHLPEAKPAIELLVGSINDILMDHNIHRA